ncbi:MAG: hypothetical protein V9E96_09845 [Chitinophagaceae bacterium]
MVKDKDIKAAIALLPQKATYYFTQAQIERALPANEMQQLAANFNLVGNSFCNCKYCHTRSSKKCYKR